MEPSAAPRAASTAHPSIASTDTPRALHDAYAADGGTRAVFSSKVADYVASRPDYAPALIDWLRDVCALGDGAPVADVGAGTGLLTRQLLDAGWHVTAVEPNDGMRAAADARLGGVARYRSVGAPAEATTLPAASVRLVVAAQAFHWFDVAAARREFARILVPGGFVALVWNQRVPGDALHTALDDEVFAPFGGARRGALLAHEEQLAVPGFFAPDVPRRVDWPHAHRLDVEGLLALVHSRSYMPARATPEGAAVRVAVQALHRRFADAADGRVEVRYRTEATLGRLSSTPAT